LDELPASEIKLEGNAAREMRSASVFPSSGGLYGQRPRVIEAGAWEVKERPSSGARYAKGDRVFHQKFGYGEVTGVEDDRLDVRFDKAGEKRLIDRFVEKA
jgi:DNA helicase-2/ATP-dependent DNA helicase PcrA